MFSCQCVRWEDQTVYPVGYFIGEVPHREPGITNVRAGGVSDVNVRIAKWEGEIELSLAALTDPGRG